MSNIILETENLYKSYSINNEKLSILEDINIKIHESEIFGITGKSGCGKSTLMHLLSGLDKCNSGRVLFKGEDISKYNDEQLSTYRNKEFGFIFQKFYIEKSLTIKENVMIPLLRKNIKKDLMEQKAEVVLEQVGLQDRINHKSYELSGGELQRVCIARAIVNDPCIIFADEPTGNLDEATSDKVIQLLLGLDKTIVIVSHDPDIMKLCTKVVKIKDKGVF